MDGAHVKNMSQFREVSIADILLGSPKKQEPLIQITLFWDMT